MLLAEDGTRVGLFDDKSKAPRVERVDDIADWDALIVADLAAAHDVARDALAASIPIVVAHDTDELDAIGSPLVLGALEGRRLAAALAALGTGHEVLETQLAWTDEGRPLDEGVAVFFPDPIGALWAEPADHDDEPHGGLVAPTGGRWRGALATLTYASDRGVDRTIYGIADDHRFLDGLVLAAAGLAAAEGAYSAGRSGPGDPGGRFLEIARASGLEIASFTPAG